MLSKELRKKFLQYFKEKGHTIVPSSSTVPHDDPTLLFNNAGMNQFKDVFLGKTVRDYSRATSTQKCIRVGGKHNDLDQVGHTKRHITFFEMLGNFSFGDYFKKEAIAYAWEVATTLFQFPEEKLFVSVYEEDEEAFALWSEIVDEKKISRIGKKDNFWTMGETGPCGPCSELFYDRGPEFGTARAVHEDTDGERFLEFWNLVFMEYNQNPDGSLTPLPKPSVDTGAGLERIVSLMMDVPTVFQTDILQALIQEVERISKRKYDANDPKLAPAFHVIADHVRTLAFTIADGAQPSNIERGYVLRKVLRRAVRYGRMLGLERPFLADLLPTLTDLMGKDFHELKTAQTRTADILTLEEESFLQTLRRGGNILNAIIEKAHKEISGEEAFKLKDTYGFPLEEILLIAKDAGLSVNIPQYQLLEKKAKERSRSSKQTHLQTLAPTLFETFTEKHGTSTFVGYDHVKTESTIKGLIVNGESVETMKEGEEGLVILDETPFYAEQGGQVGDTGTLTHQEACFQVKGCEKPFPGVIAHVGILEKGALLVGEPVQAAIDVKRRSAIAKHHTATHLLHFALEEVLGSHIRQAGSLVEPNRLRFDFNHHKGLSHEEIRQIETLINEKIWDNALVEIKEVPFETVQNEPSIKAFFGEKYGNQVRVVAIGPYSKELCGGTHVRQVGSIGIFRIAKEGSIAKGVRRIEAVIGSEAEKMRYETEDQLLELSKLVKSNVSKLSGTIEDLISENEKLKEQALFARKKMLSDLAQSLLSDVKKVGDISVLSAVVDIEKKEMIELGNDLIQRMQSGVLLLCVSDEEKCQLLIKVSSDLVQKGIYANELIKHVSSYIEGSGGGKKDAAQAGGKNPKGIVTAFEKIYDLFNS